MDRNEKEEYFINKCVENGICDDAEKLKNKVSNYSDPVLDIKIRFMKKLIEED